MIVKVIKWPGDGDNDGEQTHVFFMYLAMGC